MPPRTDLLPSAIVRHNELKAELLLRFNTLADDPEALLDNAEGEGSTLSDLLKRVVWEIRKVARDRDAIRARQMDLLNRARVLNDREERLRALVAHGMSEGGIETLNDVEWSAGLAKTAPKLVVTDESMLAPSWFIQPEPPPPVLDKGALAEYLKRGAEMAGAHLSNGGTTLTIRPKRAKKGDAE